MAIQAHERAPEYQVFWEIDGTVTIQSVDIESVRPMKVVTRRYSTLISKHQGEQCSFGEP